MNPKMQSSEAADFLNISLQAVHKQLKSKKIDYHKSQNRVFFDHNAAKELFNLKLRPTCWTWQNLKGGVGKTQLSFATAIKLTLYGAKVAVIDLDQQGNFTQACNIDAEDKPILIDIITTKMNIKDCMVKVIDGLDLLPSRIDNALLDNLFAINSLPVDRELKKRVIELKKHYDFIFIDCPPSLGASVCAAAISSDFIVIPTDPEKFSVSGLKITLEEITKNLYEKYDASIPIKIVLNKFDARTNLSHQVLSSLIENEDYRKKLFKAFIRTSQSFPNAIANAETIFDSLRTSTAKEDINLLAKEILELSKNLTED